MGRLARIGDGALQLVGVLIGVTFTSFLLGGTVYRSECTLENGRHTTSWSLEGPPYLWDSGERCEAHTLTRHVLGKLGVMEDTGS